MKKQNVLLIALLFGISAIAPAQGLITFGVRSGLNLSTIFGEPDLDFYGDHWYYSSHVDKSKSSKLSFSLGADALYKLNDKMGLQAELFYSREGYKGGWAYMYEGPNTSKFTDKYSFLSLPVFFKYNFTKHFYVMGGPQFSFLLAAKHKDELGGESYDMSNTMNKMGIGLVPVVGYDLNKLSFGIRYYAGLTQLVKSEYNTNIKSEVFSVVVSYKIVTLKK